MKANENSGVLTLLFLVWAIKQKNILMFINWYEICLRCDKIKEVLSDISNSQWQMDRIRIC